MNAIIQLSICHQSLSGVDHPRKPSSSRTYFKWTYIILKKYPEKLPQIWLRFFSLGVEYPLISVSNDSTFC